MNRKQIRLFLSFFILLGAFFLWIGVKILHTANASKSWPTVTGKVVSSSVGTQRGDKGGITYHGEVLYEYVVDGKTLSSHELSFGDYGSNDPSHAREVVNKYPVGTVVTVHYSPSNPEKAVLEPGIIGHTYFVPIFGAIFFTGPLLMFIFAPQSMQRVNNRSDNCE